MQMYGWFAIPQQLHVEALAFESGVVSILASLRGCVAQCPVCKHSSRRVHSQYRRTLTDLPSGGVPVQYHVTIRKLFCDNPLCPRKVFAERLGDVAYRHARRTNRQREALEDIGLALGGRAGARLAARLGLVASRDTLLHLLRRLPLHINYTPRILGVDDWSLKRAQTYGTILVDLEWHRVVDLLPERSSDALAAWLAEHPGVEVIARDGSNAYADGAARGAPDAIQHPEGTRDRFHLVANLREALRQLLERNRGRLPAVGAESETATGTGGCPQPEQDFSLLARIIHALAGDRGHRPYRTQRLPHEERYGEPSLYGKGRNVLCRHPPQVGSTRE